MTPLTRHTTLYFLFPRRFIDTDFNWRDFDIEQWSEEYDWEEDEWGGLRDTTDRAKRVLDEDDGDCDDYSIVALSYLVSTTDHELDLVALFSLRPLKGHIVVYDRTDGLVYSSGKIMPIDVENYMAVTPYEYSFHRSVQ